MIRILFIFALALLPEGLFAQTASTAKPPQEWITKVIRVHYGDPHSIAIVLQNTAQPVNVAWDDALKAVVLHGKSSDVADATQIVKELDNPPAVSTTGDIELVVYVVGGSNEPMASSSNNELSKIEPVVKQLRTIFPYKHYELVTTMFMRSQQGEAAGSSGLIQYPFDSKDLAFPANYQVRYNPATVSSDKSRPVVHLRHFEFKTQIGMHKAPTQSTDSGQPIPSWANFSSDVDLPVGQTVVVGNTNVAGNSALFIILTAKLVD